MNLDHELQRLVAGSDVKVRIGYPWWLRPLLFRNVVGITLGRRIYLAELRAFGEAEDVVRVLRHELAHVRQVAALGLPRFLWRYGVEYVRNRRLGLKSEEAYRNISFEREAEIAESEAGGRDSQLS